MLMWVKRSETFINVEHCYIFGDRKMVKISIILRVLLLAVFVFATIISVVKNELFWCACFALLSMGYFYVFWCEYREGYLYDAP